MSSAFPRVSIIIPTYNRADLLPQTVESCLAQTYPNLEIIVVDDGSTDSTAEMMGRYGDRIVYVRQDRQGMLKARRYGLRQASGEFIAFLDSDDLILPTKIERQVQMLTERPEAGLCHGWYYTVDEQGRKLDLMMDLPETNVLAELICRCFIWSGAPLMRRAWLETVGVLDPARRWWSYDWDLWLHMALAGCPFTCVREPVGFYRIHANALSSGVEVVEQRIFSVLDAVYADPHAPAEVHPVRSRAYASWHAWFAFRYYAVGRWEKAQHHLTIALDASHPDVAHPRDLAVQIGNHAVNGRSADPLKYVDDVFAHLPPQAEEAHAYRRQVEAAVHQTLALRLYRFGDSAAAAEHLAMAATLDPEQALQPDRFMDQVMYHAVHLSDDPPAVYISRVMQHLPPEAETLRPLYFPLLERLGDRVHLTHHDAAETLFPAARAYLMYKLTHDPSLAANSRAVAEVIVQQAAHLPDPEAYVRWILQNPPPSPTDLKAHQSWMLGVLSLKRAFDSFTAGRRTETIANALRGIRHHPLSIANRGVIAIIARSLLPGFRKGA